MANANRFNSSAIIMAQKWHISEWATTLGHRLSQQAVRVGSCLGVTQEQSNMEQWRENTERRARSGQIGLHISTSGEDNTSALDQAIKILEGSLSEMPSKENAHEEADTEASVLGCPETAGSENTRDQNNLEASVIESPELPSPESTLLEVDVEPSTVHHPRDVSLSGETSSASAKHPADSIGPLNNEQSKKGFTISKWFSAVKQKQKTEKALKLKGSKQPKMAKGQRECDGLPATADTSAKMDSVEFSPENIFQQNKAEQSESVMSEVSTGLPSDQIQEMQETSENILQQEGTKLSLSTDTQYATVSDDLQASIIPESNLEKRLPNILSGARLSDESESTEIQTQLQLSVLNEDDTVKVSELDSDILKGTSDVVESSSSSSLSSTRKPSSPQILTCDVSEEIVLMTSPSDNEVPEESRKPSSLSSFNNEPTNTAGEYNRQNRGHDKDNNKKGATCISIGPTLNHSGQLHVSSAGPTYQSGLLPGALWDKVKRLSVYSPDDLSQDSVIPDTPVSLGTMDPLSDPASIHSLGLSSTLASALASVPSSAPFTPAVQTPSLAQALLPPGSLGQTIGSHLPVVPPSTGRAQSLIPVSTQDNMLDRDENGVGERRNTLCATGILKSLVLSGMLTAIAAPELNTSELHQGSPPGNSLPTTSSHVDDCNEEKDHMKTTESLSNTCSDAAWRRAIFAKPSVYENAEWEEIPLPSEQARSDTNAKEPMPVTVSTGSHSVSSLERHGRSCTQDERLNKLDPTLAKEELGNRNKLQDASVEEDTSDDSVSNGSRKLLKKNCSSVKFCPVVTEFIEGCSSTSSFLKNEDIQEMCNRDPEMITRISGLSRRLSAMIDRSGISIGNLPIAMDRKHHPRGSVNEVKSHPRRPSAMLVDCKGILTNRSGSFSQYKPRSSLVMRRRSSAKERSGTFSSSEEISDAEIPKSAPDTGSEEEIVIASTDLQSPKSKDPQSEFMYRETALDHYKEFVEFEERAKFMKLNNRFVDTKESIEDKLDHVEEAMEMARAYYFDQYGADSGRWRRLINCILRRKDESTAISIPSIPYRKKIHVRRQLEAIPTFRPWFTGIISVIHLVVLIIIMSLGGLTTIHVEPQLQLREGVRTFRGQETAEHWSIPNIWIGPSPFHLIKMGALFAPCMRDDITINSEYLKAGFASDMNLGCCEAKARSIAGTTFESECTNISLVSTRWRSGVMCSERSRTDMLLPQAIMPCCHGLRGQCSMTSHEHCTLLEGTFHVNGPDHCSQVNCLSELCGMGGLPSDHANPYKPSMANQHWRILLAMFFHHGILHVLLVVFLQGLIGWQVEVVAGGVRLGVIYFVSLIMGLLTGAIFSPYVPHVGATPAVAGLLAIVLVEIVQSWKIIKRPALELLKVIAAMILLLVSGTLPYVDNFEVIGGFIFGGLSALVFLPYVTFGWWHAVGKRVIMCCSLLIIALLCLFVFHMFYSIQTVSETCLFCQWLNCVPYSKNMCNITQLW